MNMVKGITSLKFFFLSPNITWFVLTLVLYNLFPYDLTAAKTYSSSWMVKRLLINYTFCGAYYLCFYVPLYVMDLGKRKFRPGLYPTIWNCLHDLTYWSLG